MITLYQFATSPFCQKVRRILHRKGLDFTLHEVPRAEIAKYAWVSPTGKLPAIDHDGHAVWDSTDIAHYLEAHFPDPPLLPRDRAERARVHVLEDWADESLYFYEMTMRLAWEHNARRKVVHEFVATMPGISVEAALAHITKAVGAITTTQGLGRKPRSQVVLDAERHLEAIDGLVAEGDWLVGDHPTLADLAVASQVDALRYAEEAEAVVARLPALQAWIRRVDQVAPA